jgi:Pyruvate/2-oxoacid:ferredoxin oxidoreductase delta subunit
VSYSNAVFAFFTGTGNSYRVAAWMAAAARADGASTELVPIRAASPEKIGNGADSLLGLVCPTHGFTTPWAMLRFVLGLPRRRGTHAVVVSTRAGTRLGRHFLPGMEGTAAYLVVLILTLKGYRVRGVTAIDMPSNWLAVHPPLSAFSVDGIVGRAESKIGDFMATILAGRRRFAGWFCLFLGLLLLPVSVAYVLVGRFYLSKTFFASDACTGCDLCAEHCPMGAIKMWEWRGKRRPYWTFDCESCMRCMAYCPTQAIEAGQSWAVIIYVIGSASVSGAMLRAVMARFPALQSFNVGLMGFLAAYLYRIASLYVGYLLLTLLLRVPLINRLFTLTTFTHYYGRYHAPEAPVREI